jgi:subtilisin-like proprotein convertase family protein
LENEDNSNYDGYANSIYTIAVAAVDSLGLQAYYSEPGANLVVAAPSNGSSPALGILTTDNKGDFGYNPGFQVGDLLGHPNNTETFGGTSSATPAVSGVIALMLQRNPNLGWRDVQEILMRSAAQVGALDPDWITANRTDHVTGNSTASFQFNHKYGAGLVDAAAAVAFSGNWTNLGPQKFLFASNNTTTPIAAGATVNRTFSINGTNLRSEHVTLEVTLTDIPKGDLTVTLTSPGNTTSTFCEPHSDSSNTLNRWKFMTVRNWAENSNGNWTLSITSNGTATGNLTETELVVYGSEPGSTANPEPIVTLASSHLDVFVGASLELTATAIDQNADGTQGSISLLEAFFSDGNATQSLGVSANGSWTLIAQRAGNFSLTVNATDSQGLVKSSRPVSLRVTDVPLAAWDFDTTAQSPVPLATTLQSVRRYAANFGSGTLLFDGTYNDSQLVPTNRWDFNSGQISSTAGTSQNAIADMVAQDASNKAILVRGGKNIGAQGKGLVFQFSMANQGDLNVTYAANTESGGFSSHSWSWSVNGTTWTPITSIVPSSGFSQLTLPTITQLGNHTTAYLRVDFSGATAASGTNALDNIILSATPITPPNLPASPFLSVAKNSTAKGPSDIQSHSSTPPATSSQSAHEPIAPVSWMEWSNPVVSDYQMIIHAEIVDGAVFLQSPGSLLSAHFSGSVVGLAEPVSGSHRYELRIYRPDSTQVPLELKFYNPETQSLWTIAQPVLFQSSTTLGTPTQPVRYQVVRPPSNLAPVKNLTHYGIWMNLPPNAIVTMEWIDTDNDGIDDRRQSGPGQEQPTSAPLPSQSPVSPQNQATATQLKKTNKQFLKKKQSLKMKKTARKSKVRKL